MYSRQALRDLRQRETIAPARPAAPKTLAELPADVPMNNGAIGFWDDDLGEFIDPDKWMQRHRFDNVEDSAQ